MEKDPKKIPKEQKNILNAKRKVIIGLVILLIIAVIAVAIVYNTNIEFQNFMDTYIFRKDVKEEDVPTIEVEYNSNTEVIPYGRYICLLAENTLFQYNSSGKKEKEVKIEINYPIYNTEGRYLVIGEKNSKKLYLLSGDHIVWEKEVDGNLSKVSVNKNGYVSAILTGTTHKSVIVTYDEKGNELFKSYLSTTIAVDSNISPDNSELAYAEVNNSGTSITSTIKVISMSEAQQKDTEAKYTYQAPQNSLVLRIKYQNKNQIICMYDNSIHKLESGTDLEILKLEEDTAKVTFADILLNGYIYRTVEKSKGLFSTNTILEMKNIESDKENIYTFEEVVKSTVSNGNVIAVNLGTEVYFITTGGWLLKRYNSNQVVQNMVLCDGMAGIIYRDKIELVSL